jgi:hypothetical protein
MRGFIVVASLMLVGCGRQESVTTPNSTNPGETPTALPSRAPVKLAQLSPMTSRSAASSVAPLPSSSSDAPTVLAASAPVSRANASPFGIASSHLSSQRLSTWLPVVRSAGVTWLRGFDVATAELSLTAIEKQQLNVSGILLWGPPGKALTFPVNDLKGWSNHVNGLVSRNKTRVQHWEVWNEPPNFTQDKSPESYAKVVVAAYEAAKRADPSVQVGIAAKSNHVQWLESAIRAGAKDHFDYVTLHPYEVLDMVAEGGEALFLNIVPTVRAMLRAHNPTRADVPIWFTELGTPVSATTTPELQAARLIKAYTLSIAQGVTHVHWFEGQDGDSGAFGLIDAAGKKRVSLTALSSLIATLGPTPNYVGWVTPKDGIYGFVFRTPSDVTMVAWASPAASQKLTFDAQVTAIDPTKGSSALTKQVSASTLPVIVTGLPASWAEQATTNRALPFPWGGDFTGARAVSLVAPNIAQGLHQFGEPAIRTFGGKPARDASTRATQSFAVDPNFATYVTGPLTISVVVRRNGSTSAGFKLSYESTSGWKTAGGWYTIPESDTFTTKEYTLTDAEFVGNWAYHFALDSDSKANSQYSVQSVTVTKHTAHQ